MITNEFNVGEEFTMRVNFNLKQFNDKNSQIWLTTTISGERVRIFTKLNIEPRFWIRTTRFQIGERANENLGDCQQKKFNRLINSKIDAILEFCNDYSDIVCGNNPIEGTMPHTPNNFKRYISNRINGLDDSVSSYILRLIEAKKKEFNRNGVRISEETVQNHQYCFNLLNDYCQESHKRLAWNLFDRSFERLFTSWCWRRNFKANTIMSQFKIIKHWLNRAEEDGLISNGSFHHYKSKAGNADGTTHVYLTEDEIQRIYDIDFDSDVIKEQLGRQLAQSCIERTRDMFCFACWCGLRFKDWNAPKEVVMSGDVAIVRTYNNKTQEYSCAPITPIMQSVIDKYGGIEHVKLTMRGKGVSKSTAIKHIQRCAKLAGINEEVQIKETKGGEVSHTIKPKYQLITTHVARRSAASNYHKRGASWADIMAMTGHKSEDTLKRYVCLTDIEKAARLAV